MSSMVMCVDHPGLTFTLALVRTEPTYNQPMQQWSFVSDFAVSSPTPPQLKHTHTHTPKVFIGMGNIHDHLQIPNHERSNNKYTNIGHFVKNIVGFII